MGAKRLVLYGAIINVVGTFATPTVASYFGAVPLVMLRFIMGFGQVCLHTMTVVKACIQQE